MRLVTGATERICWTRMQSEAGEGLPKILRRKDLERRAGAGLFFWGVGNAPARAIPDPRHQSRVVSKFMSNLMRDGKKSVAFRVFYDAMDRIQEKIPDQEPITVFTQAVENIRRLTGQDRAEGRAELHPSSTSPLYRGRLTSMRAELGLR